MTTQRTFSIIKPDAVQKGHLGEIAARFEKNGLKIIGMKMIQMTQSQAEEFYAEHKERPFFGELVDFMISGPCVVQVLEGEDAIARNRELMGATNPNNAEEGTIRYDFARPVDDLSANAVHGSDSEESAQREIGFFFSSEELVTRTCSSAQAA
ncbi:MAG: nucleoside-diphosphate kinase [Alphaproteobacteria bacterium]|nr:nucleoside-diphosphate kinase [Alphaproteobacteria bacterium]MDD9919686.1 nucleoside-diphosphate kinase [Alphaproteobacteria bacterium]